MQNHISVLILISKREKVICTDNSKIITNKKKLSEEDS